MKTHIYIVIIILFACSLQVMANDSSDINALNKDAYESVESLKSKRRKEQREKMEAEVGRLVERYGMELLNPMKLAAADRQNPNRRIALEVLVQLGESDPVKQAFHELIVNKDDLVRRNSLAALAKLGKDTAREVALSAINATANPNLKSVYAPLLSAVGDPNKDT